MEKSLYEPDTTATSEHQEVNLAHELELYGPKGFRGIFSSRHVALCAAFSAIGGLLFGYDQGVISVTLEMDHFLERFPEVADTAPGAGFYKDLMTAMITLGALNQGWVADLYSRKNSIMIAVVIFTVGSAMQTGAANYGMLVTARLIGGIGIAMLSAELSIVVGIVVSFWITYGAQNISSNWSNTIGRQSR